MVELQHNLVSFWLLTSFEWASLMFIGHIFATSPRTERGKPTILKGDPKGKNFLYTNGINVIIRDIEVSLDFHKPW